MRTRVSELVAPLGQCSVRRLFVAQLVSGLGDWAGRLALAVLIFDRSGSTLWTAAVTIVSLVPWLGAGQLLSTFADRFGRVRVMVVADLARTALFVAMLAPLPIWTLLALAFAAGLGVPPFLSARSAAIVDVVEPGHYGALLALLGVATQLELVAGYAVGGALIAVFDARTALAVNATTFVVSAALLGGLRTTAAAHRHENAPVGWRGLSDGLRPWRDDPVCRRALALFAGVNMWMIMPEALVVPYATELGAPQSVVGVLAATIAIGTAIAMAIAPDQPDHAGLLRVAALRAAVLALVSAALFAGSTTIAWLGVGALLVSGAVDALAVPTNQVAGSRLPAQGRAAAMSIAGGVQYGLQTVTISIGAAIAAGVGSRAVLTVTTLAGGAVALWLALRPIPTPAHPPAATAAVAISPWPPPTTPPTQR